MRLDFCDHIGEVLPRNNGPVKKRRLRWAVFLRASCVGPLRLDGPCTPQKHHPISRCDFFQPIFMVQPAENILDSDPAGGWQLMPLNCRSSYWLPWRSRMPGPKLECGRP